MRGIRRYGLAAGACETISVDRGVAGKRFVAAGAVELAWIMAHLAGMISPADAIMRREIRFCAEGKEGS